MILLCALFFMMFSEEKSSLNQRNCSQESNETLFFFLLLVQHCRMHLCWNDKEIRLENAHRQTDQSDYCYVRVCLFVCLSADNVKERKWHGEHANRYVLSFAVCVCVCVCEYVARFNDCLCQLVRTFISRCDRQRHWCCCCFFFFVCWDNRHSWILYDHHELRTSEYMGWVQYRSP